MTKGVQMGRSTNTPGMDRPCSTVSTWYSQHAESQHLSVKRAWLRVSGLGLQPSELKWLQVKIKTSCLGLSGLRVQPSSSFGFPCPTGLEQAEVRRPAPDAAGSLGPSS